VETGKRTKSCCVWRGESYPVLFGKGIRRVAIVDVALSPPGDRYWKREKQLD